MRLSKIAEMDFTHLAPSHDMIGHSRGVSSMSAPLADSSVPPASFRIGLLFNPKKRSVFGPSVFPHRHYSLFHPLTGELVTVEVINMVDHHQLRREPTEMMLMKLTDLQSRAHARDDEESRLDAIRTIEEVRDTIEAIRRTQTIVVIDELDKVEQLLDRAKIQQIARDLPMHDGSRCTIPQAILYQRPSPASQHHTSVAPSSTSSIGSMTVCHSLALDMRFPVICKSLAACGSHASHRMYVLHARDDFDRMHAREEEIRTAAHTSNIAPCTAEAHTTPDAESPIWLVQDYINHSGVIFKVYVLDEEVYILPKVRL